MPCVLLYFHKTNVYVLRLQASAHQLQMDPYNHGQFSTPSFQPMSFWDGLKIFGAVVIVITLVYIVWQWAESERIHAEQDSTIAPDTTVKTIDEGMDLEYNDHEETDDQESRTIVLENLPLS